MQIGKVVLSLLRQSNSAKTKNKRQMKTVIIKQYIRGLASFLDEENIKWEHVGDIFIKIYYHDEEDLFRIGFRFGKFYETVDA